MHDLGLLLAAPTWLLAAVQVVALVMILIGVRGTARALAIVALAVQVVGAITSMVYAWLMPSVYQRVGAGIGQLQTVASALNLVLTVVDAVGLVLIGLAVGRNPAAEGTSR